MSEPHCFSDRLTLMHRMGAALGSDLITAVAEHRLSGMGLRSAALRCGSCPGAKVCARWLDVHETQSPDTPPAFCSNRELFTALNAS